jgi:hypothetical protein
MNEILELVLATAFFAVILFVLPGAILRWMERVRWVRFTQAKVWGSTSRDAIARMQVGDYIKLPLSDARLARRGQKSFLEWGDRAIVAHTTRAPNGEWMDRVVRITRVAPATAPETTPPQNPEESKEGKEESEELKTLKRRIAYARFCTERDSFLKKVLGEYDKLSERRRSRLELAYPIESAKGRELLVWARDGGFDISSREGVVRVGGFRSLCIRHCPTPVPEWFPSALRDADRPKYAWTQVESLPRLEQELVGLVQARDALLTKNGEEKI